MSKKEKFIEYVESFITDDIDADILDYFETLKAEKPKAKFTENGIKILEWMRANEDEYENGFKTKNIGEGLFTSGRSVAGSMRKLISDGYVEKVKNDTVTTYFLTEEGRTVNLTN